MFKYSKFLFTIGLALLLSFLIVVSNQTFANTLSPSRSGDVKKVTLILNQKQMAYPEEPYLLKGQIMVPAKWFMESISAQVYTYEAHNQLVAYKDNVFVKFTAGKDTYTLNGYPSAMPIHALTHKSQIYVPLSVVANAFELNYSYEESTKTVYLNYREEVHQYRQIGYYHYKRVKLLDWGVSFYVPEYWETMSDAYGAYGFIADYEHYRIDSRILPLDDTFTRVSLLKSLQENLLYAHDKAIEITGTKLIQVGDSYASALYYTLDNPDPKRRTHHILYVIFENKTGYLFTATYTDLNDNPLSREIFDTIVSTFEINKLSINNLSEHYVEFNTFFNADIHLDTLLYSNMVVENQLHFKGKVGLNDALLGFYVEISKDNDAVMMYVPVRNNSFDKFIYTPFGLGKHNIKIYAHMNDTPTDDGTVQINPTITSLGDYIKLTLAEDSKINRDKPILNMSVVNLSSDPIKDLLPSQFVDFDNPDIFTTSSRITYNLTSSYAKALGIYEWLYLNYTLDTTSFDGDLKSIGDLVQLKSANVLELPLLYVGLLRAIDIPARVVQGTSGDFTHFWTEAYINGKWLVADISGDLKIKIDGGPSNGFNASKLSFYEKFTQIETLPF
ncbi:stalk domain-containing protein [Fusibacter tunisiensis]|uniref:Transglutaminase-like domain-containing protein n=1 Tax=Fusibacter tunisiensis TaxID=1008308 RepID=A0ABS2MPG6_9FIRM|nr:stalk domain-containing protein [Fusibacter tunisiensis]MBM7561282.1 hypothetical protein [Fusibacter tunisiensis]